jgi:hypothetical protein
MTLKNLLIAHAAEINQDMKKKSIPNVGDTIYVDSHMYISHGSDDVVGGKATVSKVNVNSRLPEGHINSVFVSVKEHPGHSYNWFDLETRQAKLKKEFSDKRAYPDPDIDTPWIEDGDIVNGEVYHGKDIW